MSEKYKPHGNLMSYKVYIRPTARRMYGYATGTHTQHQKNIQGMLKIMFLNGSGTTWDMARTRLRSIDDVREQEKIFRRLIIGRYDRGRYSSGVMDIGLVTGEKTKKSPYQSYRLTLHGILYYIDAFDPSQKEMDMMAAKYAPVLPRVFGRWPQLKESLGTDTYNIKILAKGLYLNNINMANANTPLYELMSYIHIKYRRSFEIIKEKDLAEQISYWFYTFLLYGNKKDRLKKILSQDESTNKWYTEFFRQTVDYYEQRLLALSRSKHMFK